MPVIGQRVPDDLPRMIAANAHRGDIREEMRRLYAEVDRAIRSRGPVCWNRGLCCRFAEAGHHLFVTPLEVVYFVQHHGWPPTPPRVDTCPAYQGGRCVARLGRPLGCRVFYCQASARWWQPGLSEQYLTRLRALHERLGLAWVYAEWLAVLDALARQSGCGGPTCEEAGDWPPDRSAPGGVRRSLPVLSRPDG